MDAKVKLFKDFWTHNYSYISLELTDEEIQYYIEESHSIALACNQAADHLLSSGSADVEE